jgi:hypothetical protein
MHKARSWVLPWASCRGLYRECRQQLGRPPRTTHVFAVACVPADGRTSGAQAVRASLSEGAAETCLAIRCAPSAPFCLRGRQGKSLRRGLGALVVWRTAAATGVTMMVALAPSLAAQVGAPYRGTTERWRSSSGVPTAVGDPVVSDQAQDAPKFPKITARSESAPKIDTATAKTA